MKFLEVLGYIFLVLVTIAITPIAIWVALQFLKLVVVSATIFIALLIPLGILAVPFALLAVFLAWAGRAIRKFGRADRNRTDI